MGYYLEHGRAEVSVLTELLLAVGGGAEVRTNWSDFLYFVGRGDEMNVRSALFGDEGGQKVLGSPPSQKTKLLANSYTWSVE